AGGYFPAVIPGIDSTFAWVLGVVAALLLFASVLVHELAHSFVARSRGLEVDSITLFIFGGVSNLSSESPDARTEFAIAVVGPITSFVIAAVSYGIAQLIPDPAWQAVVGYLAIVNALLGAFNLIPGFPLDGGRVLRSIAWGITKSLRRATEIAVGAGQIVGGLFILWGVIQIFSGGDLINGLWIAAIGWFLQNAASSSLQQVVLTERLKLVRVGDVQRTDTATVSRQTTVEELIERYLLPGNRRAMPVSDDGRLVGMVTLGDIKEVPAELRATTQVGAVMGGRDGLVTVHPGDTLADALNALASRDLEQVPVIDGERYVGMLTRADLVRQLQLRETLDLDAETRPQGRAAHA
ncbi:MAG TPA: site-2 protease family protein, partial [Candidatus Limnocylindria bacterium]|nr:site-2 protease family protein [Candidatus Limnocylindria bacterium]